MTAPTQPVTINLADFGGPAVAGIEVTAEPSDIDYTADGTFISSKSISATSGAGGALVMQCFPNALVSNGGLGTRGTTIRFRAKLPGSKRFDVQAAIPNHACNLVDCVVDDEPVGLSGSQLAAQQAQAARNEAVPAASSAAADAVLTAADRVQTGQDRTQTGLDRTQTGLDRIATGADRSAAASSELNAANYAAVAATGAKFADTIALGLASVADAQTFGVKAGGSDSLVRPTIFRRDSSSTYTPIAALIASGEFDALFDQEATGYAFAVTDKNPGRMALYVTVGGRTWFIPDPSVVFPGAQVSGLPVASLASDVLARIFPSSFSTDGGEAPGYALAFIDSNKRISEVCLDETGRFPAWVAKAISARSGVRFPMGGTIALAEAYTDVSGLANGVTIPFDSGQVTAVFGNAPLYVSGGEVVHDQIVPTNNAGYLQAALGGRVTRIGAAFKFAVGAPSAASIALVLPSATWVNGPTATAGVHFVLLATGSWHVSNWSGSSESPIYASGNIADLRDNANHFVDIVVDPDASSINILFPDGSQQTITNALIAANTSNLAVWELYEATAVTPRGRFTGMWAQSRALFTPKHDGRPLAASIAQFQQKR